MAIFSRRTIQRMINENAEFLTQDQLARHVLHLNREGKGFLDTEWEIAVLNIFSKLGTVEHEPDLGTSRKIDLLFTSKAKSEVQFIADIASVTDEGFEEENLAEAFAKELIKRLNKLNLRVNSFSYQLRGFPSFPQRTKKKKIVKLPERGKFDREIFNKDFKRFLTDITQRPEAIHHYSIYSAETDLLISYNPNQLCFTSVGVTYRNAYSVTNNPVYNTLKRKAVQLKAVNFEGPRGIIICDGGSNMMNAEPKSGYTFSYNASDVVKEFLRQNQSITFVLTASSLWVERWSSSFREDKPRIVKTILYKNESFQLMAKELQETLSAFGKSFPYPDNTSEGARLTIMGKHDSKKFIPFYRGLQVSSHEIKISARVVLGLLAGSIDQQQFLKDYRFMPSEVSGMLLRNPFEYQMSQGNKISELEIESSESDDNYLVFRFEGPDAAVTAFKSPPGKDKS